MLILAIETSCDDTSLALVKDGKEIIETMTSTQIKEHELYGGVVPEVAARAHEVWLPLILEKMSVKDKSIDAIAVTEGPGLHGSLMLGQMMAKSLAFLLQKPLIKVNHLEGHIYSNFIEKDPVFPAMVLIVSGGHTHLYLMKGHSDYALIGKTKDDAVGEAFDKAARMLGLGYPGGPAIEKLAQSGDALKINFPKVQMPDFNFSYSGLKTSVLQMIKKDPNISKADVAAGFQKAAFEQVIIKAVEACLANKVKYLFVAGGVSANQYLRNELTSRAKEKGIEVYVPPMKYCTDNAAMIGVAAYYKAQNEKNCSALDFSAQPGLKLG
jgi:N6-L-threonylcarbamoyladenine synthase